MPSRAWRLVPALSNPKLFARDRYVCAYCGGRFLVDELTREHIVPISRGGSDSWMNCITACRGCNGRKGNRLPEEAHMTLLYLPYVPSLHEDMILRGRRIVADQMDFLLASVPRRIHTCTVDEMILYPRVTEPAQGDRRPLVQHRWFALRRRSAPNRGDSCHDTPIHLA